MLKQIKVTINNKKANTAVSPLSSRGISMPYLYIYGKMRKEKKSLDDMMQVVKWKENVIYMHCSGGFDINNFMIDID